MNKYLTKLTFYSISFFFGFLFLATLNVSFGQTIYGDANGDGRVDGIDYVIWLNNYNTQTENGASAGDFNEDGRVDGVDYVVWLNTYGQTVPTATPTPTPSIPTPTPTTSPQASSEWTQHAFNAQRTGWAPYELNPWINQSTGETRWQFAWMRSDVPTRTRFNVFPIVGNNRVFIAAQNNTLYALDIGSGQTVWSIAPGGDLYSTPAYDPKTTSIYVAGGSNLYRINSSGQKTHTYAAGARIETSPLVVGDFVYITSTDGRLHKINTTTFTASPADGGWIYSPGPGITQVTMPSYSASRDIIIYASDPDLKVRAINNTTGTLKWSFSTPNTYRCLEGSDWQGPQCVEYRHGWPVVADAAGVVLTRLRVTYEDTFAFSRYYTDPEYPNPPGNNQSPPNNVEIRNLLTQRKDIQSVYALDLDTGQEAFIPLVKGSGFSNGYYNMGPMPAIRTLEDGSQVAYLLFSTSKVCGLANYGWCGNREDTTVGEMVLSDNSGIKGCDQPSRDCLAGELRYVDFYYIVRGDEHGFVSGTGSTVFHSNWYSVLEGATITDRSNGLGATVQNPIKAIYTPFVIDQETSCDCNFSSSHYCNQGLKGEGRYDCNSGRIFPPGFYFYKTTNYQDTSGWNINPYVIASNGYLIIRNIDASIMAIRTPEIPLSQTNRFSQVAGLQTTKAPFVPTTGKIMTVTLTPDYIYNNGTHLQIRPKTVNATTPQLIIVKDYWDQFAPNIYTRTGRNRETWITEGRPLTVTGVLTSYHQEPTIYVTSPKQLRL